MSIVIDLDSHRSATAVHVAGLGPVVVQSARGESRLRLLLARPVRASAVLVADELLDLSTDLSRTQVRQLPSLARRRLALAVARANGWEREWRALYGTYLSVDERLVASAVCGERREWRELRARLRSARERQTVAHQPVSPGLPATVSASIRAALGINEMFRRTSGPLEAMRMGTGLDRSVARVALGLAPAARLPGIVPVTQASNFGLAGRGLAKLRLIGAGPTAIAGHTSTAKALGAIGRTPLLPDTVGRALGLQKAFATSLVHPDLREQLQAMVGVGAFQHQVDRILKPYRDVTRIQRLLDPLHSIREDLVAIGRFLDMWEDDPLWFLLSHLGTRASWQLVDLNREEVQAVLLQALEDVVREGGYVAALREAIAQADDLTEAARDYLDHAMEHAQRGEWRLALATFHPGFEGALYQAGLRRKLVPPSSGKKIEAAEKLLKRVIGEGEYVLFVVRHVYGGVGNAHRHGRADTGEREVMLSGIVALAGWVENFMNLPAVKVLVDEIQGQLPSAIEAVTGPAQLKQAA